MKKKRKGKKRYLTFSFSQNLLFDQCVKPIFVKEYENSITNKQSYRKICLKLLVVVFLYVIRYSKNNKRIKIFGIKRICCFLLVK